MLKGYMVRESLGTLKYQIKTDFNLKAKPQLALLSTSVVLKPRPARPSGVAREAIFIGKKT